MLLNNDLTNISSCDSNDNVEVFEGKRTHICRYELL
ncbi:MAG: hypothetical protein ACFWTK_02030 [Clostridium sp.]|jgi:hypothetical protein